MIAIKTPIIFLLNLIIEFQDILSSLFILAPVSLSYERPNLSFLILT